MLFNEIIEHFKAEEYEKLAEVVTSVDINDLAIELQKIDKELLAEIFPKLPEDISAEVFVKFSSDLQFYLTQNISDIEFKDISEELLDNDVEDSVKGEVLNEILLKAEVDTRHEKLLEIIDDIENKKFSTLKPLLSEMRPFDIAELINDIDEDKVVPIFRLLPKYLANEAFVEMDSETQEIIIKAFTDKDLSAIINDLFVDDTVDLIEEMPSNVVRRILKVVNKETRESINKIMGFPKDSAGSIMTPECITLRPWMTVDESLTKMRRQAFDKETIYTCYVTDDEKKLLGIVTAKDLILHQPTDKIETFMHENIVSAHTHTDKEEVSTMLSDYNLLAIPIVDSENRINGIVTIDDAIDVIQEEASEDISKITGMAPTTKPYLQTSIFFLFKSRIPWLIILLFSSTFTSIIINSYESTLSTILVACIPMLMGTSGNSGSQSSVTIIQSLSLGEISFRDIFKVIWKEIRVAFCISIVLGVSCFAKLQLIDKLIFGYPYDIINSLIVSVSLVVTICIAKIVGCCLPMIAKKIHLDPAVVANPFITTIIDVISILIFAQFALIIL